MKKFVFILLMTSIVVNAQDTCNDEYIENVGFIKLGSYKGRTSCGHSYGKTYYISQIFRTFWIHTRQICQAYGMELLSLETVDEMNYFLTICDKNINLFEDYTHIGGYNAVGKNTDQWYWTNSGKRIDYPLKFAAGQPDFAGGQEYCLSVSKKPKDFGFADLYCQVYHDFKFICQKIDY